MVRDLEKGLHQYRHKQNPRERVASELWAKNLSVLPHLLGPGDGTTVEPTEREWQVTATLMQWLGSPVGQGYLGDLKSAWDRLERGRKAKPK